MNILTKVSFAILCIGITLGVPRQRRDSTSLIYDLPSNATSVVGEIQTGFDCEDLPYGYYADEANNCAVFHVCLPYIDHNVYYVRHFSFFCGEGTVFDQVRLICDIPENALPCAESSAYRNANEYFGKEDVNFLE